MFSRLIDRLLERSKLFVVLSMIWGFVNIPALAKPSETSETIVFHGDCDASTAIATGKDTFFVIGDEKKPKARFYNTRGELLDEVALKSFLTPGTEDEEPDLEASAKLKETVFVLGSHGRDNDGNLCPERNQLFAFKYATKNNKLELERVGITVTSLHEQIVKRFPELKLDSDPKHNNDKLAPKDGTSINIEGLAADPIHDDLLIGLRSPLTVDKKAIVMRLKEPFKLVKNEVKEATLEKPAATLELNGEGIRSMEYWPENKCYIIVSGNCGETRGFSIYKWSGAASDKNPKEILNSRTEKTFNPEAIVLFPGEKKRFLLLSDDGKQQIDGLDCKKVDKLKRHFAGRWFSYK